MQAEGGQRATKAGLHPVQEKDGALPNRGPFSGEPAGRNDEAHTACNSCKQEKAMVMMLGREEMLKLFEY